MTTRTARSERSAGTSGSGTGEVRRSPRERLLDAASELFYAEGIQSVGIDRVIERAGVAKASLYSTFGSKEELVRAYLDARHARTVGRLRAAAAQPTDPVARILAVFDAHAVNLGSPGFRGCAFNAALAEAPADGRVAEAAREYLADLAALFDELTEALGIADPPTLSRQLQILYQGATSVTNLGHDPAVAGAERAAAETLVQAAIAAAAPV